MERLPDKTVERLSKYRRALFASMIEGKTHIYSHEIAKMFHITPVQVRRDIMLIGYSGSQSKGYYIKGLTELISDIIDTPEGIKAAVVGMGNLGRSIIGYFNGKRSKLTIVAAFDINPEKVDKEFVGVKCYPYDKLTEIVKKEKISVGVITVPAIAAVNVAENLIKSGVKGILNYAPKSLNVPSSVYLEEYDMITSLEKVAYFVKH
jgi:redox-sensing transcriptional repressor